MVTGDVATITRGIRVFQNGLVLHYIALNAPLSRVCTSQELLTKVVASTPIWDAATWRDYCEGDIAPATSSMFLSHTRQRHRVLTKGRPRGVIGRPIKTPLLVLQRRADGTRTKK